MKQFLKRLFFPEYEYQQMDRYPRWGEYFWMKDHRGNWNHVRCNGINAQENDVYYDVGTAWSFTSLRNCYKRKRK